MNRSCKKQLSSLMRCLPFLNAFLTPKRSICSCSGYVMKEVFRFWTIFMNFSNYLSPISMWILLWQLRHKLMRLPRECVPPLLIGKTWCTSWAGTIFPSFSHCSHSGCWLMCLSRMRFQARPYFLLISGARSYLLYCLRATAAWSSQYWPSISFGQPGYEHGLLGLLGTLVLLL